MENEQQSSNNKKTSSTIGIKLLIFILILPLAIAIISSLCNNRSKMQDIAQNDIVNKWGNDQTIIPPFIAKQNNSVIYKVIYTPKTLIADVKLFPEIRYRGIFQCVLYKGEVKINAKFSPIKDATDLKMFIPISDIKGIADVKATINGKDVKISYNNSIEDKLTSIIPTEQANTGLDITLTISIRGGKNFLIAPIAKTNKINISANWASPSFIGYTLPTTRDISNESFNATWDISSFLEQQQLSNFEKLSVGVSLLVPTSSNVYSLVNRSLTYSFLFITIFVCFFLVAEFITKTYSNPIQFAIIVCASIVFYLLLLSFAEIIEFVPAFIISAIIISSLVSTYISVVLNSKKAFFGILISLGISYALMLVILRLETLALLVGSLIIIVTITSLMCITAKLNR